MCFVIDGETRSIGPGDVIVITPGEWHKVRSSSPTNKRQSLADTFTEAPMDRGGQSR
jgi:quercetin dioxygenase-like cupin family protein